MVVKEPIPEANEHNQGDDARNAAGAHVRASDVLVQHLFKGQLASEGVQLDLGRRSFWLALVEELAGLVVAILASVPRGAVRGSGRRQYPRARGVVREIPPRIHRSVLRARLRGRRGRAWTHTECAGRGNIRTPRSFQRINGRGDQVPVGNGNGDDSPCQHKSEMRSKSFVPTISVKTARFLELRRRHRWSVDVHRLSASVRQWATRVGFFAVDNLHFNSFYFHLTTGTVRSCRVNAVLDNRNGAESICVGDDGPSVKKRSGGRDIALSASRQVENL